MIEYLLFLSYYVFDYSKNATSYFQKYPFLEYGFKRGATYNFDFHYKQTEMVFGLATQKEIERIELLKNFRELCDGYQQLSKIQYLITKNYSINGIIPSKSILTPYSFTCDKNYSIEIGIEYFNTESHIDYRCQYISMVCFIYTILISIIISCYIIYSFYNCCRSGIVNLFLFSSILISFSIEGIISIIFWAKFKKCESEYLDDLYSHKYVFIFSIRTGVSTIHMFVYFMSAILIINYISNKCSFCMLFIYGSVTIVTILAFNICSTFFNLKAFYISVVLFVVFICEILFVKPICSLSKTGLIIYIIGSYFDFGVASFLLSYIQEKMAIHYFIFIIQIVSISTQFIALVAILLGLLYYNEYNQSNLNPAPIIRHRNPYTLTTRNNYESENRESVQQLNYSINNEEPNKPNLNDQNENNNFVDDCPSPYAQQPFSYANIY